MPTTVTFSGRVADVPRLHHTSEGTPYVTCRVLVHRRPPSSDGETDDDEPTTHHVRVYGLAAHNVFEALGIGDPIIVHGLHGTETWLDKESGDILAKSVVVVDNDFGEVGVSLR
jgi:single-strand DNA-binding protein